MMFLDPGFRDAANSGKQPGRASREFPQNREIFAM